MSHEYTSLIFHHPPDSLEEFCRECVSSGYTNEEICAILASKHRIQISSRHLRRIFSRIGLSRNKKWSFASAATAVQMELQGSGQTIGYRAMQKRLSSRYGMIVPRSVVSSIQRTLDPEGVDARKNKRLRRRAYSNEGPNFLVHIDGYDKLKRYGFAIHGAIDGRILWLGVGRTNNKPEVVASYFINYLADIKGVPRCIRIDAGTENILIEDIQRAFRFDHLDTSARNCVVMGSSPHNQRIERYWRNYREGGGQFWMDLFKGLQNDGYLDIGNNMHVDYLRFSFMEVIRTDLNFQRIEWNQHAIRTSSNAETRSGKPDLMYFTPELYGTVDFKTPVQEEDITNVRTEFCETPNPRGCDQQFDQTCLQLMNVNGKMMPNNHTEAVQLYLWFISQIIN